MRNELQSSENDLVNANSHFSLSFTASSSSLLKVPIIGDVLHDLDWWCTINSQSKNEQSLFLSRKMSFQLCMVALFVFCYFLSGTPKGAMITNGNITSTMAGLQMNYEVCWSFCNTKHVSAAPAKHKKNQCLYYLYTYICFYFIRRSEAFNGAPRIV